MLEGINKAMSELLSHFKIVHGFWTFFLNCVYKALHYHPELLALTKIRDKQLGYRLV